MWKFGSGTARCDAYDAVCVCPLIDSCKQPTKDTLPTTRTCC
jgi:hypothetical protein